MPKCSGPKPAGKSAASAKALAPMGLSKKGGKAAAVAKIIAKVEGGSSKGGCKDSHAQICQAAKEYGHCKHASYANQCKKSCGKCSKTAIKKALRKRSVAKILAKVEAKKELKMTKKPC